MISILLNIVFINSLYAKQNFCQDPPKANSQYESLIKEREEKINKLANSSLLAQQADQVLSNLIKAKSQVLMSWLKSRNLFSASEVEIAKKWRRYYVENFILGRYPNKNPKINQTVESLIDSIYKKYLSSTVQTKFENIFREARKSSLDKIKSYPISEKTKKKLLDRVGKIQLYWMKDFKSSRFKQKPLEVFSWGVAYDPISNEINIGLEAIQYNHDETLFSVFAHELGHAFDPCRWGAFLDGEENPFKKVTSCLRGPKSVQAKKRDDSKIEEFIRYKKISKELALALKLHPTCNKLQYPPEGVQADQMAESFSDWFSAEVLSESNYISKNLRMDLCNKKNLRKGSSYPKNQDRLEKIYFAHPKIKKKLKIKNKSQYCSFT